MKRVFIINVIVGLLSIAGLSSAQQFTEQSEYFRTEVIRASGLDTIMLERHATVTVPEVPDDSALIYHEPLPDNTMPKSAIDIGILTIQAESSDEVVEILEEKAREFGADWVIGFNEPRRKKIGNEYIYRSQARLFRVIDPTLVDGASMQMVYASEERIPDLASAYVWVTRYIVEDGQDDE
jgi:hypothetical protein